MSVKVVIFYSCVSGFESTVHTITHSLIHELLGYSQNRRLLPVTTSVMPGVLWLAALPVLAASGLLGLPAPLCAHGSP